MIPANQFKTSLASDGEIRQKPFLFKPALVKCLPVSARRVFFSRGLQMAWIESHEELGDHHKTLKLAELLNCNVPTAVGHLHLLWHYTLKVAWKDGDLSQHPSNAIARACWWNGNPELIIKCFQESGFLDGMVVHKWKDYASQIIYQRLYNENRRQNRAKFPMSSCKEAVHTPATLPNLTIPNQLLMSKPEKSLFKKPTAEDVEAYAASIGFQLKGSYFVDYYESKGWVVGHSKMKNWKAAVRTWKANRDSEPPKDGQNKNQIRSAEETRKIIKELTS